jgi:hypothetical protein
MDREKETARFGPMTAYGAGAWVISISGAVACSGAVRMMTTVVRRRFRRSRSSVFSVRFKADAKPASSRSRTSMLCNGRDKFASPFKVGVPGARSLERVRHHGVVVGGVGP